MPPNRPPKILLVVPDSDERQHLIRLLEIDGNEVSAFASGAEVGTAAEGIDLAVAAFEQLDLPAADFFARLRAIPYQAHLPILALLRENSRVVEQALNAGADDYVAQPVIAAAFTRRVKRMLEAQDAHNKFIESERRWLQTYADGRVPQLLIDPVSGMIVDANAAAIEFYGYSRETLKQKFLYDLNVTGEEPLNLEVSTAFNYYHRLASGTVCAVNLFSSSVEVGGQSLLHTSVFDNSKRLRAERSAEDHRRMAQALRNAATAVSQSLELDEVLDQILNEVYEVVHPDAANIMLIEDDVARIVRMRGYENHTSDEEVLATRFPLSETPNLRQIAETRRPIRIADAQNYEGWLHLQMSGWIGSNLGVPVFDEQTLFGFLVVDSASTDYFTELDAERLQAFAASAAVALRNARLYDRVREQATALENRVAERTAELDSGRSQLQAILDAMIEGVVYTEFNGINEQVRYTNRALIELLGFSSQEWMSKPGLMRPLGMNQADYHRAIQVLLDTLRHDGRYYGENRFERKDGSVLDAAVTVSAVKDSEGALVGSVAVVRNISREQELQVQKTRFVAYASHELRTPITNLKTRLYLLRKQPERLEQHLAVLDEVTDRMRRLVEGLLDVSRFERGAISLERQLLDLRALITRSVAVQTPESERKRLRLTAELPPEPLLVDVDGERIIQVITNLLTNAINYTHPEGRIMVRAYCLHGGAGQYAVVEVEDTGIGIAAEHLPYLFQPFYRVQNQIEGTGLGLPISKEIVELHRGKISVSSEPGKGTCFSFRLPMLQTGDPVDAPLSESNPNIHISPASTL